MDGSCQIVRPVLIRVALKNELLKIYSITPQFFCATQEKLLGIFTKLSAHLGVAQATRILNAKP